MISGSWDCSRVTKPSQCWSFKALELSVQSVIVLPQGLIQVNGRTTPVALWEQYFLVKKPLNGGCCRLCKLLTRFCPNTLSREIWQWAVHCISLFPLMHCCLLDIAHCSAAQYRTLDCTSFQEQHYRCRGTGVQTLPAGGQPQQNILWHSSMCSILHINTFSAQSLHIGQSILVCKLGQNQCTGRART